MQESYSLYTTLGNLDAANIVRASLAGVFTQYEQISEAVPLINECLQYNIQTHKDWDAARVQFALGQIAYMQGRTPEAKLLFETSLRFYTEVDFRLLKQLIRFWLSAALADLGDMPEALELISPELQPFEQDGDISAIRIGSFMMGSTLISVERHAVASEIMERAGRYHEAYQTRCNRIRAALEAGASELASVLHTGWEQASESQIEGCPSCEWHVLGFILAAQKANTRMAMHHLSSALHEVCTNVRRPLLYRMLPAAVVFTINNGRPDIAGQCQDTCKHLEQWMGFVPGSWMREQQKAALKALAACNQMEQAGTDHSICDGDIAPLCNLLMEFTAAGITGLSN